MAFQYQRRSQDHWQKRREQQGGDFEGIFSDQFQIFKDKKGKNTIRILPPTWKDPEHYGLDIHVHYNVGPKGTVLCPKEHFGKKCPMCEAYAEAIRDATSEDEKRAAGQLRANRRVAVWVLNRDDEEKGPLLWAMPWRLDKEIAEQAEDPQTHELYELDDPAEGFDLFFDREGGGTTTKRNGLKLARRSSSVNKKWINFVAAHPLPDVLQWRTYNEIKALYAGEEEEETPPPRGSRRAEPDDDDAPPPRRTRQTAPDDEDEPPPRRSTRRAEPDDKDEAPPPRRTRQAEPEDDEPPPRRSRASNGAAAEEDEIPWDRIEKPRRRAAAEEEEEPAAPTVRQRLRPKAEPEDDEPPPRRRAAAPDDDDEPPPRGGTSGLRDAIARRRQA